MSDIVAKENMVPEVNNPEDISDDDMSEEMLEA